MCFRCGENFYRPKLRSTPLITLLNLSIIHWSLSLKKAQEQFGMLQIESYAKQHIHWQIYDLY